MVSLSDLYGDPKTIDLEILKDAPVLRLSYYPSVLTPEMEEAFYRAREGDAASASAPVMDMLAPMLASWELVDAQGQPVPPTREGMRRVPISCLFAILEGVLADAYPNQTTDESSVGS